MGFPGDSVVKKLSANVFRDPWVGKDLLAKWTATYASILAWELPWTEELAGYSPWGHKRVDHDLATRQQGPHLIEKEEQKGRREEEKN